MFNSVGLRVRGEEYVLPEEPQVVQDNIIGIENRAGDTWKLKRWNKYSELISLLKI